MEQPNYDLFYPEVQKGINEFYEKNKSDILKETERRNDASFEIEISKKNLVEFENKKNEYELDFKLVLYNGHNGHKWELLARTIQKNGSKSFCYTQVASDYEEKSTYNGVWSPICAVSEVIRNSTLRGLLENQ